MKLLMNGSIEMTVNEFVSLIGGLRRGAASLEGRDLAVSLGNAPRLVSYCPQLARLSGDGLYKRAYEAAKRQPMRSQVEKPRQPQRQSRKQAK